MKITNILLLIFIITFVIISANTLYQREIDKNPEFKKQLETLDFGGLIKDDIPSTKFFSFLGNQDAPVTLISYLDIGSEETKNFIEGIMPQIKEEFINSGKINYYQKYYITNKDVETRNSRFIFTKTLFCVSMLDQKNYYNISFDLMKTKEINHQKYNLSKDKLNSCIQNNNFDQINQDMLEMKRLNIIGVKQKLFLVSEGLPNQKMEGIPAYTPFRRMIIQKLFSAGEAI
jgi:hypothetical protein